MIIVIKVTQVNSTLLAGSAQFTLYLTRFSYPMYAGYYYDHHDQSDLFQQRFLVADTLITKLADGRLHIVDPFQPISERQESV